MTKRENYRLSTPSEGRKVDVEFEAERFLPQGRRPEQAQGCVFLVGVRGFARADLAEAEEEKKKKQKKKNRPRKTRKTGQVWTNEILSPGRTRNVRAEAGKKRRASVLCSGRVSVC